MQLDHVNIHARDLEAMRDFFMALLGLKVGWRPNFDFAGYWLYLGEPPDLPAGSPPPAEAPRAIIHLQERKTAPGPGWADHLAFGPCGDPDHMRNDLVGLGFPFKETRLVDTDIVQFFVTGPEDVKIELQCRKG